MSVFVVWDPQIWHFDTACSGVWLSVAYWYVCPLPTPCHESFPTFVSREMLGVPNGEPGHWFRPRESYKPSYQSGLQSVEISTLPQHSRGKHFDCGWIDCTPRDQPHVSDTFLSLCQQCYKLHELHFPHGHVRLFMETSECRWWQAAY